MLGEAITCLGLFLFIFAFLHKSSRRDELNMPRLESCLQAHPNAPRHKIRECNVALVPSGRPLSPSGWSCSKRLFPVLFKSLSRQHIFPFERYVPVTVLLVLKLFPRSRVCEAIINTPLYKERGTNFHPKKFVRGCA